MVNYDSNLTLFVIIFHSIFNVRFTHFKLDFGFALFDQVHHTWDEEDDDGDS